MPLTFAQAHLLVGMVAGVHPKRSETFKSRLKQWQKMGFPEGTRVGKGARAEYGATQVLQLLLLVKLLRIGLTPERAQYVIFTAWERFKAGFCEAIICIANREDHLHYFMIQVDALSDLTSSEGSDHLHLYVDVFTDTEMRMVWNDADPDWDDKQKSQKEFSTFLLRNRMAVAISLEIDSLLVWLLMALDRLEISPEIFSDEFNDWIADARKADFKSIGDHEHFDDDIFNQSVAQRGENFDRAHAARLLISKTIENDRAHS